MYVRSGDAYRIIDRGFKPNKFAVLDWNRSVGDFIYFISYSNAGWKLEVAKFLKTVEIIISEVYRTLDELLTRYDQLIDRKSSDEL